jgi:two-component system response regulator RegX3
MDLDRHHVEVNGRRVILPLKQFRLLELLMSHAGQVVSNRSIVDHVWGPLERVDRNTVQAHVARLRQTLGDEEVARRVRAVPGVGYTFPR